MYYKFLQLLLGTSSLLLRQETAHMEGRLESWVSDAFCGDECRWLRTVCCVSTAAWGSTKSLFLVTYPGVFLLSERLSLNTDASLGHTGGCMRPRRKWAAEHWESGKHRCTSGLSFLVVVLAKEEAGGLMPECPVPAVRAALGIAPEFSLGVGHLGDCVK